MSRNEVRIIGGLWKGRKLKVPAGAAVRPSLGRVRETLFNWLAGEVAGSDCLDLFAGSGALGFEALSRGARSVVLVDNNRTTAAVLRKNAQRLGAANCTVRRQSALAFLKRAAGASSAKGTRNRAGLASSGADTGAPAGESRMTAPRADDGVGEAILRWDIVFLDPPFSSNLLHAALEALQGGNALNPGARIYFELERRAAFDAHGFTILKEGAAGDTRFGLLASP